MITYYFQIIFLALIQGVSEFIPVSSSAHLFLISNIGKFSIQSLEIDISLHLGSLLAILIYFRSELINIIINFASDKVSKILLASLKGLFQILSKFQNKIALVRKAL